MDVYRKAPRYAVNLVIFDSTLRWLWNKKKKCVFIEHSWLILKIFYLSTSILPASYDDMMLLCSFFFSPFSIPQWFEVTLACSFMKIKKRMTKTVRFKKKTYIVFSPNPNILIFSSYGLKQYFCAHARYIVLLNAFRHSSRHNYR